MMTVRGMGFNHFARNHFAKRHGAMGWIAHISPPSRGLGGFILFH
jgi:hypothetical protein